jgi:hypothetical protein
MIENSGSRLRDEIGLIGGQSFHVAAQSDSWQPWGHLDPDVVCESNGMHDGPEIVVTVGTPIQNAENQIDFRGGMNGERCIGGEEG